VRALYDVFGADNPLSKSMQGIEGYLDGLLSAQAKRDQQEVGRILQEAEDKGAGDQVKAALQAFTVAPLDLVSQALGTAAPALIGGLATTALKVGSTGVGMVTGGIGSGMGVGIVKGEIYEAVKDGLKDSGMPEADIEQVAQQAQSYGGENLDQIALGGLLGAVGARTGIEAAIIPGLTGKISQQLARKGFGKFAQTVSGEAITEAAQGGQEQLAQNIAQQRVGLDVPTMRGVVGQATLEGVTGGGLGAGVGFVSGDPNQRKETATPAPTATEERIQQLREEQQTADYMRNVEQLELEEQSALEAAQNAKTAEEIQGQVETLGAEIGSIRLQAEGLEGSVETLVNARERLNSLRQNIPRTPEARELRTQIQDQLKAISTQIQQAKDLAKTSGIDLQRRLRPGFQGVIEGVAEADIDATTAPVAPTVDRTLTKSDLVDQVGLPPNAGYTKQLAGLNLDIPAQRTKAAEIIGRAMENPRLSPEVKSSLRALYDGRISPPVADAQRAFDFDTAPEQEVTPEVTQEAAVPARFTDETFDSLGIGKTAVLRRNEDLRAADLTTPEGRAYTRNVLEIYRDTPNRSEAIRDKINAYLDQLPDDTAPVTDTIPETGVTSTVDPVLTEPLTEPPVDQAVVTPEGAPDATTTPATEPTVERPASEPSMGVADVGDGSTPAQTGAAGAVSEPATTGLVAPVGGAEPDTTGSRDVPGTVTPPESRLAENNLAELARNDDIEFDDVAAAALNAQLEGRITPEDAQLVVQSESAQEALTTLEVVLEASRGDVVRVVNMLHAVGDSAGAVSPELLSAINQSNVQGALEAILADTTATFNTIEQQLARNILDRRVALPTMRVVDTLGTDSTGVPILGQYNSITDEITLVRGTEDSHTFLHELTHAFVHRTIIEQQQLGARNPAFRDLQAVYDHVLKARPELAEEYGLSSLTEFASEIMSNREFQFQMMGVPYQNTSVFSWFGRALRKFFGFDDRAVQQHALFAGIVAVDGLMRDGRSYQIETTGKRLNDFSIAYAVQNVDTPLGRTLPRTFAEVDTAVDPVQRSEMRKFVNAISQAQVPLADIIRQQTVDIFAPLARKLSDAFSQGVRSAFGDVNPIIWLRQAQDHDRIALQVFRKGGLRMDKDGTWQAFDLKDSNGKPVSPQTIVNTIQALADKQNMTYAQAKARVGTLLESMRLKDLRAHNSKLEALAREKSKAGDLDGAYEIRTEKFALHKTNAEIDADVAIVEATPEVQEVQRVMNAIRSNLIDAMVVSGRLSKDRAETWRAAANYVPFDRFRDMLENPDVVFTPGKRGIAVLSKLPELRGSLDRPVTNTVDNFMKKMAWMTQQSMQASAVTRTLDFMVEAGMARRIASPAQADNNLYVVPMQYKDGKPVYYEVQNRYDLAAFVGAPEVTSGMIKALGFVSRGLRTLITATPMFAIKQVIDDSQRVVFNSGVQNPMAALGRTLYNFPRIWWAQAFGQEFGAMRRMEALGIAGEFDYNPINPLETLEADTRAVPRSPMRALIHAMEQGARASDMAARLAVYEQTMQETGDTLLAQQRARELINFNRRGSSKAMRSIVHVVPFFNSWAQGMDLLYRGMTGVDAPSGMDLARARRMFMGRVATLSALSFAYAFAMADDDYYKELSDDVRDRHWVLPKQISDGLGLKQPLKLTVPNEFGFFFKSIPERVVQYINEAQRGEQRDASEVVSKAIASLGSEYLFMPIPAAFKPVLENSFNYSTFTGRPLVPPNLKNAPKDMQYTSATSEIAKALGKTTGQSPILIDNAIRGYFGMAGGAISVVADSLMNPSRPDRGPEQVPFLSIGLVAPVGTRSKNEFYDFRQQVTEAVTGARLTAEREPQNYAAFERKNAHLLEAAPFVNNYVKRLDRIRDARKSYENDIYMSGAEKREKLIELQQLENEAIKDFRVLRAETLRKRK
jgi:hypothetical protein